MFIFKKCLKNTLNRAIRTYTVHAHGSRDTIKQWSFDKVGVKAMPFPIPNVNIDI